MKIIVKLTITLLCMTNILTGAMQSPRILPPIVDTAESANGKRMEDRTSIINDDSRFGWYAVFDGHGGGEASAILSDMLGAHVIFEAKCAPIPEALAQSFSTMENLFNRSTRFNRMGSTAITVLLDKLMHTIYTANVGDSRAVLAHNGQAIPLSTDHKPDQPNELRRINAAGFGIESSPMSLTTVLRNREIPLSELPANIDFIPGISRWKKHLFRNPDSKLTLQLGVPVLMSKQKVRYMFATNAQIIVPIGTILKLSTRSGFSYHEFRVPARIGGLAVSRSFGDNRLKAEYPHALIADPEITEHQLIPGDQFIILASDGLWDVVSSEDAVNIVKNAFAGGITPKNAARLLVNEALWKNSHDNIAVMIIDLRDYVAAMNPQP